MAGADGDWRLERAGGALVARCALLEACGAVVHAFSTRQGAEGDALDLGGAEPGARHAAFLRGAGFGGDPAAMVRQVHGDRVVRAREALAERPPPAADAVIALAGDRPRAAPGVRCADCVPVLLADRDGRAVAAAHAGWRGTASQVARRAVEALGAAGVAPGRLVAALGPAVGPCCYPVGAEVARAVERASGAGVTGAGGRVDLRRANRQQLEAAGLAAGAIAEAPWCTACRADLFWSHRRQGARRGSLLAVVGFIGGAA